MVYILHQRLQAQSVQEEKARKVLQDVVRAMYSPLFITELFKPQEMYSTASTKQIFEKLAHSSIMRLNKSSMEKLYDLMTMGFKYQAVSCSSPHQLLHVTLNHLESLKKIVKAEKVEELIQVAIDKTVETFSSLNNGQWLSLRQSLFRFLQGKKIKVSLFLQQGLQTMDGTIVLNNNGKLPFGTEIPGTIRYYDGKSITVTKNFESGAPSGCSESEYVLDVNSTLGLNMYAKDNAEAKTLYPESSLLAAKAIASHIGVTAPSKSKRSGITSKSAKQELNMLSDLLGISVGAKHEAEAKPFKINLFPDLNFDKADGKDSGSGSASSNIIIIDIDGSADTKSFNRYLQELNLDDEKDAKPGRKIVADEEEDDLLALMDASK